jgi:hypothetical protein
VTEEQVRRLREHYQAFSEHERFLQGAQSELDYSTFRPIADRLTTVEAEFPDLVPEFRPEHFVASHAGSDRTFSTSAVRAHLAAVLGRIRPLVERRRLPGSTPEARAFPFVADDRLRAILERDWLELQRARAAGCWKAVILLAGGALESILVDQLRRDEARARAASSAPPEPDLAQWGLAELLNVSVELAMVKPYLEINVGDATRAYRLLVRPMDEARSGLAFAEDEATALLTVLDVLHRDLSKA